MGCQIAEKNAHEIEIMRQQEYAREAVDESDSFIEEVPEELEQSKMTYPAGFRSGMKMTGLHEFHEQPESGHVKTKR